MSYVTAYQALLMDVWENIVFRHGDDFVANVIIDKEALKSWEYCLEETEHTDYKFTQRMLVYHEVKRRSILGIIRAKPKNVTSVILYHYCHWPHYLPHKRVELDKTCTRPECAEIELRYNEDRQTVILQRINDGVRLDNFEPYEGEEFLDTHLTLKNISNFAGSQFNAKRILDVFERIGREVASCFRPEEAQSELHRVQEEIRDMRNDIEYPDAYD